MIFYYLLYNITALFYSVYLVGGLKFSMKDKGGRDIEKSIRIDSILT